MLKRMMSIALAAVLCMAMLVGCGGGKDDAVSDSDDTSSAVYDEEGCRELLDSIMSYESGTAGSSLKAALVASDILGWTEQNEADKSAIAETASEYFGGYEADELSAFRASFNEIDEIASSIIAGDEYALSLLTDAGEETGDAEYSQEKYDVFSGAVNEQLDALGVEVPVELVNFDVDACTELLEAIAGIDSASTSEVVTVAVEMIDFIIDLKDCTTEEIREGVKESYNSLSDDAKEKLNDNANAVVAYVDSVLGDSSLWSIVAGHLDADSFDSSNYQALIDELEELTGQDLS